MRFLFPCLATTPRISWVFAKVRLDCEDRRPSPNFAEWVPTMFSYQYASQTQACCEACEPCDLLWKLTVRLVLPEISCAAKNADIAPVWTALCPGYPPGESWEVTSICSVVGGDIRKSEIRSSAPGSGLQTAADSALQTTAGLGLALVTFGSVFVWPFFHFVPSMPTSINPDSFPLEVRCYSRHGDSGALRCLLVGRELVKCWKNLGYIYNLPSAEGVS